MPFFMPFAPPCAAGQGGLAAQAQASSAVSTVSTAGAVKALGELCATHEVGPAADDRGEQAGSRADPGGSATHEAREANEADEADEAHVAHVAQDLAALAAGSALAIEPIYRRESARVYRYALALCGNEAWAADATQEAFVALALRPAGFDASKGSLGAYLAGVARHALAKTWRQARHEQTLADAEAPAETDRDDDGTQTSDPASPESLLQSAQDGAAVWRALRRLPSIFREAVVLVDLQERPYAEAAAIAGIELNTLRTRLHRARARLAILLRTPQDRTP